MYIEALKKLEVLTLSRNNLTNKLDGIHELDNLKVLMLDGNKISKIQSTFCFLDKLENLYLIRNMLKEL